MAHDEFFTKIPDWLARDRNLSWTEKALWARIRRYGRCVASNATLARELGVSPQQIQRYRNRLLAAGFLEETRERPGRPRIIRAVRPR